MDGLWIIVPLVVGVMLWIGLSSKKRRRSAFGDARTRYASHGNLEVVYECLNQLVATNSDQDFVVVVDAKFSAKDSSGRVVARFDRTIGFAVSQVESCLKVSETAKPVANDLITYELKLRGVTTGDDGISTVRLSGYRSDICPWTSKLFGTVTT